MKTIIQTEAFVVWLDGLRDDRAVAMIARRLIRLGQGNPGDFKSVGDGVLEMRIDHGPGYRVYYTVMDDTVVLWGGTKTTQARDIAKAKRLKGDWK